MSLSLCSSSERLINPYATQSQSKTRKKPQIIVTIIFTVAILLYYGYGTSYLPSPPTNTNHRMERNTNNKSNDISRAKEIFKNKHENSSSGVKSTTITKTAAERRTDNNNESKSSNGLDILKKQNNHPNKSESISTSENDGNGNAKNRKKEQKPRSSFVPTLRGKKVFFEVVTVGLKQFSYLEDIIDSVRDLCEAGAHVSFHITSSNCNPNPKPTDEPCVIRNQSSDETKEDNFSVETISQLNERVKCRNPEGSLDTSIHLISPDWGKQIVDHHRLLFYENIDKDFDVFVHTEDDTLIRPSNIISFMDEMEKVRLLVGDERLPDYSIGFMRYENEIERNDRRRVVWEFKWDDELEMVSHPGIEGSYFISPPWHHQGMFMATTQQLLAWKTRGPDCHFHKIERREGYHTERISGALDLYDEDYCNVTQLLPLDSLDDFLIHHLPNLNNQRSPSKIISTRDLHKMRLWKMQDMDPDRKIHADANGVYDGITMLLDERVEEHSMHFDLKDYNEYVERGGRLTGDQVKYWG